ncbi:MAG: ribbon-helix-helix domain-containing protein [Methanoregulaceae archaeon]|jgi:Arc/MetJ-type ribon-helix-helix transcriptional regulator
MTAKSMLVQVRIPPRLVGTLDRMAREGLYTSRSEAILDAVRRLALAYEEKDPFRQALVRKYLGKPGKGSVEDLARCFEPEEVYEAIGKAFPGKSIEEIIDEVRR